MVATSEARAQTPPPARTSKRRLLVALARALVTLVILGVLLAVLPLGDVVSAMRRIPPGLWFLTVLGFLTGHAVSAMKWRLLLSVCGANPSALQALRAHAAGLFANLCLPSLVGGDLIRAGIVTRSGGRIETVVVGTAADRVADTAALLGVVVAAALLLPDAFGGVTGRVIVAASAGLLVVCVCGAAFVVLVDPDRLPERARAPVARLRQAVSELLRSPRRTAVAMLLAVAVQSAFVLLNARLGTAIGMELSIATWFFVWPLAKLGALVPLSLGGIGVREAALAALVLPFGVEASLAVAQSLMWETVLIGGGLVAGAWAFWFAPARRA